MNVDENCDIEFKNIELIGNIEFDIVNKELFVELLLGKIEAVVVDTVDPVVVVVVVEEEELFVELLLGKIEAVVVDTVDTVVVVVVVEEEELVVGLELVRLGRVVVVMLNETL